MPTRYLQSITTPIPSLPALKQNPLAEEMRNYAIFSYADSQLNCTQNLFTVWFLTFAIYKNSKENYCL